MDGAAIDGILRDGLFLGSAFLMHAARGFLGKARFLGKALGADALQSLLFAARHFNNRLGVNGKKVVQKLGKEAVHAPRTHVGHALLAGGVDGKHTVLEGKIGISVEQERH